MTGKNKYPAPFSLRLNESEREELKRLARGRPIGQFIKDAIFKQGQRPPTSKRAEPVDQKQIAKLLAALGQSRIASNINQLARAVNSGSLPLNEDTAKALTEAIHAVNWMRATLIKALSIKPQSAKDEEEPDDT